MDDQTLRKFIKGDESSFTLLYNEHIDSLLSYGVGLGVEKDLLQDAIQEIFIKLYVNPKLLIGVQNVRLYLFRALRNKIYDHSRGDSKVTSLDDDANFNIRVSLSDESTEDEERMEFESKVESLLSRLTNRQREAIYLRYIDEMEYEDIAQLMGISPHAVRKLVSRAMGIMRGIEKKDNEEKSK